MISFHLSGAQDTIFHFSNVWKAEDFVFIGLRKRGEGARDVWLTLISNKFSDFLSHENNFISSRGLIAPSRRPKDIEIVQPD